MVEPHEPDLGTRLLLAGHVHRRRGIVADQHGRQPRPAATAVDPLADLVAHLGAYLLGDRLAVDQTRTHLSPTLPVGFRKPAELRMAACWSVTPTPPRTPPPARRSTPRRSCTESRRWRRSRPTRPSSPAG